MVQYLPLRPSTIWYWRQGKGRVLIPLVEHNAVVSWSVKSCSFLASKQAYVPHCIFFFLRFYLFIFRQRGGERKREGEPH